MFLAFFQIIKKKLLKTRPSKREKDTKKKKHNNLQVSKEQQ